MLRISSVVRAAKKSNHHSHKHACIVFRGGSVVSVATNDERRHAEVRALTKMKDCKNVTVLSVRVGKGGDLRNARPCRACMGFLRNLGVRNVLYSSQDGSIIREGVS